MLRRETMKISDNSVALITGCGRHNGMGRAIALRLARAGTNVAVTDLTASGTRNSHERSQASSGDSISWRGLESVKAEVEALGAKATVIVGDVSVSADVDHMIEEVLGSFGRIDILVNNAAAPQGADRNVMWEVPPDAFDSVMSVNVRGVFLMCSAVARHMIERSGGGRIVNIASSAGRRGFARLAPYCASKFAVIGLTQSLAAELAGFNVTVNAVCPGPIDTARASSNRAAALESIPLGRAGRPEDVASAVAYLVSSEACYITGQALNVDGGFIMS
jgi:NAD(P)-dependent dehydrogenase (short-subunit alcohol dehydrogenase family)